MCLTQLCNSCAISRLESQFYQNEYTVVTLLIQGFIVSHCESKVSFKNIETLNQFRLKKTFKIIELNHKYAH